MDKKSREIKLLKTLLETPSPSGFEERISKYISSELLKILPKKQVKVDNRNNVIAEIKGTSNKTVMIDAHLDQIAFIVNNIDKEGTISLAYIGGGDISILSARELIILTKNGPVNAVVDRKHAHLVINESDENIDNIYEAQVDIGLRKRGQVNRYVKIGDPVIFRPAFRHLVHNYYSGYGFDDKAGCFILLEVIRDLVAKKKKPIPNLVFTFSSQEETGTMLMPIVRKYQPILFISVDVTFATDYGMYEDMEREAGRCELDKGIVLYRGISIDNKCLKLLSTIAKNKKIKIQYQASTGANIGYTSTAVIGEGEYIKTLVFGIPVRNMHTPVEIININDLISGVNLLSLFLISKKLKNILEQ